MRHSGGRQCLPWSVCWWFEYELQLKQPSELESNPDLACAELEACTRLAAFTRSLPRKLEKCTLHLASNILGDFSYSDLAQTCSLRKHYCVNVQMARDLTLRSKQGKLFRMERYRPSAWMSREDSENVS